MKKHIIILTLLIFINSVCAQEVGKLIDYDTKVYLETNINFATSAEDSRSDAQAGVGTLGIKFQRDLLYGGIKFTVYSNNDEIESETENDIKIFGSNLLIPSNSSESISSFSFLFGTKSFYKIGDIGDERSLLDLSRFGGYLSFSIDNTIWRIPENETAVTITSLDLMLAYRLLTLEFQENENGFATLSLEIGYSNRRLGGDYGLESRTNQRFDYINTDELGFDGLNLGTRLVVGDFYGQVNLTNFGNKGIPGFSGNQAVINIGFNAQLNLLARENPEAK